MNKKIKEMKKCMTPSSTSEINSEKFINNPG